MTRPIALLAALAAALLLPASSSAWVGNTFRSPTGNLVCKWRGWTDTIACGAYSRSTVIVAMHSHGRPVQGYAITFGDEDSHLLPYGTRWGAPGLVITCTSRFTGIRCVNRDGWAFLIDRSAIRVSHRGQYLWSL